MLYLDTSVVVALLTMEPRTTEVTEWFAELQHAPVCSDWLLTEFSGAISMKVRIGQLSEAHAKRVRKEFGVLAAGGLRLVPVSRTAFGRAAEIVAKHKHALRAGDSLHLAVALELGADQMATLDTTLAENAKRNGLELVRFGS